MNGTLLVGIVLTAGLVPFLVWKIGAHNILIRLANNIDKAARTAT